MGYIIEITQDKVADLSENIEKGLRYIGKAMQCVDALMDDDYGYGERGGRYGERDDDDWDDDDRMGRMGERHYGRGMGRGFYGERRGRRRDSRGRYM